MIVTYTKLWIEMDTDELQTWEQTALERIQEHKNELAQQETSLAAIRTELARRQLEAFWARNPGLRLEFGDALFNEHFPELTCKVNNVDEVTALVTVEVSETADTVSGYPPKNKLFPVKTNLKPVTLELARRMREAWLQAHGKAVE